jgi:bile-acid 7alpha-dehydratase
MADLKDLEARIKKLEDLEAIKRLKYKYFRCIDKALWDEIGDCFAEDALADYGPDPEWKIKGRAGITKFFKEMIGPAYSLCVHQGHNPEIDLTSDKTAKGQWELDNFMVASDPVKGIWIAAFYEDEYVKEKGAWKIKSTRVVFIFRSDLEKGWAKEKMTPTGHASYVFDRAKHATIVEPP